MSKACAKCERAVYPLEELKCLDKVWHKACFKCQECGMTLSMRNYKGFNRLPYCTAHCPQAKHTTVADTPEIRRIQENTKIQSTVKYHEEFEKQKGKVTQIADDPETLRIKQNTRIISNVAYHGELERKAAMEQKRPMAEGFEDVSTDQPNSGNFVFTVAYKAAAYEKMIGGELNNLKLTDYFHNNCDGNILETDFYDKQNVLSPELSNDISSNSDCIDSENDLAKNQNSSLLLCDFKSNCGGSIISAVTSELDLTEKQGICKLTNDLSSNCGGSTSSIVTFEYDLIENQSYPGSEFKLEATMPTDDVPTIKPCVSAQFLNVENEDGDRWSTIANSGSVDDLENINIVLCSGPAFDILNAVGTPLNSPVLNNVIAVDSPHSSQLRSTFAFY